jgi:predicted 2-oxoglutarate/Fe(II)-dependent dioxygenase YbiX
MSDTESHDTSSDSKRQKTSDESSDSGESCCVCEDAILAHPEKFIEITASKSPAQRALADAICKIKSNGYFAVNGTCYGYSGLTNLGLYVDNKPWAFPLTQIPESPVLQVAPFGKGEETVIDENVRRTLQVAPEHLTFVNPDYEYHIQELANRAACGLGLDEDVDVFLHKLLVYREGDHFAPHRDSVHREGMFATLVVQLPSIVTGGKLVVSNSGVTKEFSSDSVYQSTWVAFYNDCMHEVKPVESGIRVVLTYDLVRKKRTGELTVPTDVACSLKREVQAWIDDNDKADNKLRIICDHLYPRNLLHDIDPKHGYDKLAGILKGADKSRFDAIYTDNVSICLVGVNLSFVKDCDGMTYEGMDVARTALITPRKLRFVQLLDRESEPYIDYTGNEAQTGSLTLTYCAIGLSKKTTSRGGVAT